MSGFGLLTSGVDEAFANTSAAGVVIATALVAITLPTWVLLLDPPRATDLPTTWPGPTATAQGWGPSTVVDLGSSPDVEEIDEVGGQVPGLRSPVQPEQRGEGERVRPAS
ncbi:hypothetical protein [Actinomycetospora sp. NBRC 106378]|uniref:hypothetical protein n=1 Tax=Actinomycetospora sp. NBRC 106378 TaxID=3032208 RepID=UPI0024A19194|nr:hypothetical protein [Actinomycetospora sp. NBRC 106378]GLZ53391.1 hypothetical protein Acsp07_30080 [Actinomycetospora sp. NBRC 106378]